MSDLIDCTSQSQLQSFSATQGYMQCEWSSTVGLSLPVQIAELRKRHALEAAAKFPKAKS